MKRLSLLLCTLPLLGVATTLTGCGGASSLATVAAATGRATLSITWPEATRLIPTAANSITISFLQGTTVVNTQTVARPANGSSSTLSFETLPLGSLTVVASAYPNTDGTGVAQATASTTATIASGQTTAVSITMASTISSLSLTPTSPSVVAGQTVALAASALDASGSLVLTSASKLSWESSNPAVATVSSTGVVTGVAAGSATVTVTETESGKSASVGVTVNAPVSVALSPSSATISIRGTQSFSASVSGTTNQSVTWSVQESTGGSISSSGLYTAPSTAGTYHVIATSVADPSKSAIATVTVQAGGATVLVN
ncbi:Ig-like domain-containing protein [Armatimonas rosea]|uniref:Uncharacterized protein YjdB n=1 Tax=Armatimonas rosea TaxID=685828 RepID=A0A7W9SS00_ARMRO|nr:Ig-like domain-containing protein [Armatimonas rosea]MBB6051158.1 uncharacterized protein YjdB [Armatimonas rosea]